MLHMTAGKSNTRPLGINAILHQNIPFIIIPYFGAKAVGIFIASPLFDC